MPSDKDKGSAININDAKKHKKKGKSIGWILGVIILIVLSLLLVLPVTAFSGNSSVVFGSYNGENIELSYGNYFFNQVNSLLSDDDERKDMGMRARAVAETYTWDRWIPVYEKVLSDVTAR